MEDKFLNFMLKYRVTMCIAWVISCLLFALCSFREDRDIKILQSQIDEINNHTEVVTESQTTDSEILSCPFCGSENADWDCFGKDDYYIVCNDCGARSGWMDSIDLAITSWNSAKR